MVPFWKRRAGIQWYGMELDCGVSEQRNRTGMPWSLYARCTFPSYLRADSPP